MYAAKGIYSYFYSVTECDVEGDAMLLVPRILTFLQHELCFEDFLFWQSEKNEKYEIGKNTVCNLHLTICHVLIISLFFVLIQFSLT